MSHISKSHGLIASVLVTVCMVINGRFDGASSATAQEVRQSKGPASVTFSGISWWLDEPPCRTKTFAQGDFERVEMFWNPSATTPDFVEIFDLKNHRGFQINFAEKTVSNVEEPCDEKNVVEACASLPEGEAELIGEETVDGHKTLLYRIVRVHSQRGVPQFQDVVKVWLDAETKLPVRKHSETGPTNSQQIGDSEDFVWNKLLDRSLFEFKIPNGFKENKSDAAAPPAATPAAAGATPTTDPDSGQLSK